MTLDVLLHLTDPGLLRGVEDRERGSVDSYANQGIGLSGPFILRPWDDPFTVTPGDYYGLQNASTQPILAAPTNLGAGGLIYFDAEAAEDEKRIYRCCRLMDIYAAMTHYAAIVTTARDPLGDGYVTLLRMIAEDAFKYMVERDTELPELPEQDIGPAEAIAAFVSSEGTRLGKAPSWAALGIDDPELLALGQPRLGFGLMVENGFRGVYRIWSRLWFEDRSPDAAAP